MKSTVFFMLLMFITVKALAQDGVIFKVEFKPQRTYQLMIKNSSNNKLEFIAPEEVINEMKSQGIELPLLFKTELSMSLNLVTDAIDNNGLIPSVYEYGQSSIKVTAKDRTSEQRLPFAGMKIVGKFDKDNYFQIDSVTGEKVTDEIKERLVSSFEQMQQNIKFPQRPMKVGDRFNSSYPMSIPVEGMEPLRLMVNMDYTLKEIRENIAMFDIKQSIAVDLGLRDNKISASGSGSGKAEYDISENILNVTKLTLSINMSAEIEDGITMKTEIISSNEYYVQTNDSVDR